MNEGWVKLHRKILDNPIIKDQTALAIFVWLLLRTDRRTGKTTLGRKWASKELGLKQTTFYQALKRLEKKYLIIKLVTMKVTTKFTEVEIINWDKYQSNDKANDNPMTISRQSNDNPMTHIQEVENKELRNGDFKKSYNALEEFEKNLAKDLEKENKADLEEEAPF